MEHIKSIKQYFENFFSTQEPDIIIDLKIVPGKEKIHLSFSEFSSKLIEGNRFSIAAGVIKGEFDFARKRCALEVRDTIFNNPTFRLFDYFLHQLYFTLLEKKYGQKPPLKQLVHASSVIKDGNGYLFVGSPGSGKSTIAALSSGYDVLNDEITLVVQEDNHLSIHATPFNGYFKEKKNTFGPLKKIFLIKQNTRHFIQDLPGNDCIIPFARQVIPPLGILSVKNNMTLSVVFEKTTAILSRAPCYELNFLPDKWFWKCIEQFEQAEQS